MWFNRKYFTSREALYKQHCRGDNLPTINDARKWASNNEVIITAVQKIIDDANRRGNWEVTIGAFDSIDVTLNLIVLLRDSGLTAFVSTKGFYHLYCDWEPEEDDGEDDEDEDEYL